MKLIPAIACVSLFGALSAAADANIIKNGAFAPSSGKVPYWNARAAGGLAPSETGGKISFTYTTADGAMSKGSAWQALPSLPAGDYVLAFTVSGERLKAVYAVLSFDGKDGRAGKFERYIAADKLPAEGSSKRFVYAVEVPPGTSKGMLTFEALGPAGGTGGASLGDVRLTRQED